MTTASISAAVWTYAGPGGRTLVNGTPTTPTDRKSAIAKAMWEYGGGRTLTGSTVSAKIIFKNRLA